MQIGADKMGFLVNELSLHGQFADLISFKAAIGRLMAIREIVNTSGRDLYCHKSMAQADVMQNMAMPQAIKALPKNEQRALMAWLTKNGPYWTDNPKHGPNDYLECNHNIVTETAVGEAGWCRLTGIERELVSITPSNWTYSPIVVDRITDTGPTETTEVVNHWDAAALKAILRLAPTPLSSWNQLAQQSIADLTNLTFAADAFVPLNGHPFVSGAARQLRVILGTLNQFKTCFDPSGQRTPEGNTIYQDLFTGNATFTDSSDTDKDKFRTEMTFKDPGDASETIFCPWHGKVQTPQLRVHFSYPVSAKNPLYIVYVGPKITKR